MCFQLLLVAMSDGDMSPVRPCVRGDKFFLFDYVKKGAEKEMNHLQTPTVLFTPK